MVQTALRAVREPIFERDCVAHSYGFRPHRGGKDALRRVVDLLKAGYSWGVDADLKSYFDTIPHAALLDRVREADDFVILCRNQAEARQALARGQSWTAPAGLKLPPAKTRIVDATQPGGCDFLGYPFERGTRWPRRKSLEKRKDRLRAKPRRTNGQSLAVIITNLNRTLRGWFAYFQHSHPPTLVSLDQWLRTRLRSILRQRRRQRGRARGADHQRWSNAFFAACGLFSLVTAHTTACQSSGR